MGCAEVDPVELHIRVPCFFHDVSRLGCKFEAKSGRAASDLLLELTHGWPGDHQKDWHLIESGAGIFIFDFAH